LNTGTADYVESDWYGDWNFSAFGDGTSTIQHTPAPGTADLDYIPSGDEPYDVEAMYLDDDLANIYVVIVTSFPHYVAANNDVGLVDPRISANAALVRPGALSINLFSGNPRIERNSTEWHYNYGVDITHENRDNTINVGGYNTRAMRDNTLGNALYKTDYDAGGSNILDPANSDWYTSLVNGVVEAYWEHTNFDPFSTQSTPLLSFQGNVTTNYYEYNFGGGLQENGHPTYIYEFTIPRSLLGTDDLCTSDLIGIRWVEGCRNDGNGTTSASFLVGAIDYCDPPLPVTLSSFTSHEINGGVQLNWITESEIENQGFIIERRQDDKPWQEIASFQTSSGLKGQGTVTYSTKYEYIDKFVYPSNSYEYRLGDVDYNGVVTFHATESINLVPLDLTKSTEIFIVKPAYPNPFNPRTLIEYAIPTKDM